MWDLRPDPNKAQFPWATDAAAGRISARADFVDVMETYAASAGSDVETDKVTTIWRVGGLDVAREVVAQMACQEGGRWKDLDDLLTFMAHR